MTLTLDRDTLLAYLKNKGFNASHQPETDQFVLILNIDKVDFPLFIRLLPQGPILQLLVFIPSRIQEKTINDVARLLHLLNKEMDAPGFGMDEAAGVIFYRVTLPAPTNSIDVTLFDTYMSSIQLICRTFTAAIVAVASGKMTFADILKKGKQ